MPMPIYDPDGEPLDREIRLKLSGVSCSSSTRWLPSSA